MAAGAATLRGSPLRSFASDGEADTAAGRDLGPASLQAASRPREAEAPQAAASLREAPAAASLVAPSAEDLGKKLYRVLCRDMMEADGPDRSTTLSTYRDRIHRVHPRGRRWRESREGGASYRAPVARRPIRRRLDLRGGRGPRLRRAPASVGGAAWVPPSNSGWRALKLGIWRAAELAAATLASLQVEDGGY